MPIKVSYVKTLFLINQSNKELVKLVVIAKSPKTVIFSCFRFLSKGQKGQLTFTDQWGIINL